MKKRYALIFAVVLIAACGNHTEPVLVPSNDLNTQSVVRKPFFSSEAAPTPTPTATPMPEGFKDVKAVESSFIKTINQIAGEKTVNDEENRIIDISFEGKAVTVKLRADYSLGFEELVINQNSFEIFKKAFQEQIDLKNLKLDWILATTDAKGNPEMKPLISLSLSADNEKTFHWDKMVFTRLPEAVDRYEKFF